MEPANTASNLRSALEKVLVRTWGRSVTVSDLARLSGGASRESWVALVDDGSSHPERVVLRRDQPGEPRPEVIAREAAVMMAVAKRGVPVPGIVTWSDQPDDLGAAYLIMEHVSGATIPRRILRDPEHASARPLLAAQCGRILAAIHSVGVDDMPQLPAFDPLDDLLRDYLGHDDPRPVFEIAFRWLHDHRPNPNRRASLVHGDFRLGNLIVAPGGVKAVLDWELTHAGDPLEDLGWLCTRAWRFGAQLPVGGFGSYAALLDSYHAAGGSSVTVADLHWWEVFGTLRWGVLCQSQAHRHLSGGTRSVELAAIGRRVCEQEYDLLLLLDETRVGG